MIYLTNYYNRNIDEWEGRKICLSVFYPHRIGEIKNCIQAQNLIPPVYFIDEKIEDFFRSVNWNKIMKSCKDKDVFIAEVNVINILEKVLKDLGFQFTLLEKKEIDRDNTDIIADSLGYYAPKYLTHPINKYGEPVPYVTDSNFLSIPYNFRSYRPVEVLNKLSPKLPSKVYTQMLERYSGSTKPCGL